MLYFVIVLYIYSQQLHHNFHISGVESQYAPSPPSWNPDLNAWYSYARIYASHRSGLHKRVPHSSVLLQIKIQWTAATKSVCTAVIPM